MSAELGKKKHPQLTAQGSPGTCHHAPAHCPPGTRLAGTLSKACRSETPAIPFTAQHRHLCQGRGRLLGRHHTSKPPASEGVYGFHGINTRQRFPASQRSSPFSFILFNAAAGSREALATAGITKEAVFTGSSPHSLHKKHRF